MLVNVSWKFPLKRTFFFIALLQHTTHDSCLCCSVLWKMSSEILTGTERVDNEAATILEGKNR